VLVVLEQCAGTHALHPIPFGTQSILLGSPHDGVWTHPTIGLHVSFKQGSPSEQLTGVFMHAPLMGLQLSSVHMVKSLQVFCTNTQPVAGSHVSMVHSLLSLHTKGIGTHPIIGSHWYVLHLSVPLQGISGRVVDGHPVGSIH
jgi:hypothetical protein